jgi:hypothetical protein
VGILLGLILMEEAAMVTAQAILAIDSDGVLPLYAPAVQLWPVMLIDSFYVSAMPQKE